MNDGTTKIVFRTDKLLGKGSQGCVYYGYDEDVQEFAIKIFDWSKDSELQKKFRYADYKSEVELLKKVKSKHVVQLYGLA